MTDKPEGRLDLRSLDAAEEPARTDAIVEVVMSRIAVIPSEARDLRLFRRYQRRLLAAAAVLAAIATAAIARSSRSAGSADVITEWATSSHVPTNGELLAAFHGYRP
jgi:hypothetical protein